LISKYKRFPLLHQKTQNEMSLVLTAFDETFELDKGDILLFEAEIRLVRAGLGIFTAYNREILTLDGTPVIDII